MSMLDLDQEQRKKLAERYQGKATDIDAPIAVEDDSRKKELIQQLGEQASDVATVNPYAGLQSFNPQAIDIQPSGANEVMEARRKALLSLRGY